MKIKRLILILATLFGAGLASGQDTAWRGEIMLGGGYLEDPGKAYGFLQARGSFYEDDAFRHSLFLEYLGHVDDAVLEFPAFGKGGFFEDGDITFSNITVNYELEAKLDFGVSLYAGAGAGLELISLDDRFNFSFDSDSNFVSQIFAGVRINFGPVWGQLGLRYLFREDFSLLGDQFKTNDSVAYELSVSFEF